MADVILGINQGDYIYYLDESTGNDSRDWWFQGGTPTGGTAFAPSVRYLGVNVDGYDTKLIASLGVVSRTAYKEGIIVVYPETFDIDFTVTPSSQNMSQLALYSATGQTGSGINNYLWTSIPGIGSTSGPLLQTFSYTANDWFQITGTYTGLPNSSFVGSPTLSAYSDAGNFDTVNKSITYFKLGPEESVNYADSGTYATSGIYYDPQIMSIDTSAIPSIGGSNIILRFDQSSYSPKWDNSAFHSTSEIVFFFPNNQDLNVSSNKFQIILNGSALDQLAVAEGYPMKTANNEMDQGNYISPGFVSSNMYDSFVVTDYVTSGSGSSISGISSFIGSNRDWSNDAILGYLQNEHYFSGSSKFIENGGYGGKKAPLQDLVSVQAYNSSIAGYNWSGTGGSPPANLHGVCVPSSYFFDFVYGDSFPDVDINVVLRNTSNTIISSFTVILSSGGSLGNSYDGYLILAQDTGFNTFDGIATLINNEITSQGLNTNIVVESQDYWAPYENGGNELSPRYDKNSFHGLRVNILEPNIGGNILNSVSMEWGSGYNSIMSSIAILGNDYKTLSRPFASATTSTTRSWTGLRNPIVRPGTGTYFKGFKIGGQL